MNVPNHALVHLQDTRPDDLAVPPILLHEILRNHGLLTDVADLTVALVTTDVAGHLSMTTTKPLMRLFALLLLKSGDMEANTRIACVSGRRITLDTHS